MKEAPHGVASRFEALTSFDRRNIVPQFHIVDFFSIRSSPTILHICILLPWLSPPTKLELLLPRSIHPISLDLSLLLSPRPFSPSISHSQVTIGTPVCLHPSTSSCGAYPRTFARTHGTSHELIFLLLFSHVLDVVFKIWTMDVICRDMFPRDVVEAMAKLRDDIPAHDLAHTRKFDLQLLAPIPTFLEISE